MSENHERFDKGRREKISRWVSQVRIRMIDEGCWSPASDGPSYDSALALILAAGREGSSVNEEQIGQLVVELMRPSHLSPDVQIKHWLRSCGIPVTEKEKP